MQYWSWEKFNFKDRDGDASDAEIPVLNGAGAAADQNQGNKKTKFIDGAMISDACSTKLWWIYSNVILFCEDVMVAVRAFGLSCPWHK